MFRDYQADDYERHKEGGKVLGSGRSLFDLSLDERRREYYEDMEDTEDTEEEEEEKIDPR